MLSEIYFFINERSQSPVKEFINSLPVQERAKVFAYISELKAQGHNLRRPMADYLGRGIYELRPHSHRLFYFFYLKDNVVIVHAMRKKTNKIPESDIKLCLKRKEKLESTNAHSQIERLEL